MNPLRKLLVKSDVQRSVELVELIARHEEKNRPAAKAEFKRLDEEACRIGAQLSAAKEARSPTAGPLADELSRVVHRRDTSGYLYQQERGRLYGQLEALTKPAIDRFSRECQVHLGQIDGNELKKVGTVRKDYNPGLNRYTVYLPTNGHVREAAKELVEAARREVGAMQHATLPEIESAIARFEAAFEKLDFDELRDVETTESRLQELLPSTALSTGGRYDSAVMAPGSKAGGGWNIITLAEPD
jgi:hypothetical protein